MIETRLTPESVYLWTLPMFHCNGWCFTWAVTAVGGRENISTIEVETAIGRHPAVAAVAVVATPDEKWGERPKAFVELKAGEDASEGDILAFAKEHLPGYMRPAAAEIVPELPKTSTGKIQKAGLRAKEWEGRGRRIG